MGCECYKIGGPFIDEDPNCPTHGREAQMREQEAEAQRTELESLKARIKVLEEKFDRLSARRVAPRHPPPAP